jgi:ankyrin repeat protein
MFAIRFDNPALPTFNSGWRPENAEEVVISACSSLLAIVDRKGSKVVQFSHFSVKEFLTSDRLATADERLSYYHILPEPAHTILARACLSVLLQLDDKIDKNSMAHFPLALYAARHWVDHAHFRNVSTQIQEVMERLFDPERPYFVAWVWLHDTDRHWIEPMSEIHPTLPEAVPLYYASLCGFRGLVGHLIAACSQDVNSRGGSYTTPLHAASVKGHSDVASLLLENGADPNSRDKHSRAPLHKVSHGGQLVAESSVKIVRLLVDSGADVDATDGDGWTPLHAAARFGYRGIAELLLGSGASLDVRSTTQETPLQVSCLNGKLDISRFLIDRGSDMTSQDKEGCVPLHKVSRFGHVDIAQLLLDRGSDVNVCGTNLWTPLHYASQVGQLEIVRLLIDPGADLNLPESSRWTALLLASGNGKLDIAKLLVERGANVDSQNNENKTPLGIAQSMDTSTSCAS